LHGPYQNEGARRKLATTVLFAGDAHKTLPPSQPAFVSWPMAVIKKTPRRIAPIRHASVVGNR
jgi:hypothetical protein